MALGEAFHAELWRAIQDYDFPFVTFDFARDKEVQHESMRHVEAYIGQQLLANRPESVKDGLANVLYWGYARTGYRWNRIADFRDRVTEQKLSDAMRLLHQLNRTGVQQIKKLKLPQFSGLSFISKVRMFLNPTDYVVLDIQLLKLREQDQRSIFHEVAWKKGAAIPITRKNEIVYEQWCEICRRAAKGEFGETNTRAVDIERGIFHLIQTGRASLAAEIVVSI